MTIKQLINHLNKYPEDTYLMDSNKCSIDYDYFKYNIDYKSIIIG